MQQRRGAFVDFLRQLWPTLPPELKAPKFVRTTWLFKMREASGVPRWRRGPDGGPSTAWRQQTQEMVEQHRRREEVAAAEAAAKAERKAQRERAKDEKERVQRERVAAALAAADGTAAPLPVRAAADAPTDGGGAKPLAFYRVELFGGPLNVGESSIGGSTSASGRFGGARRGVRRAAEACAVGWSSGSGWIPVFST